MGAGDSKVVNSLNGFCSPDGSGFWVRIDLAYNRRHCVEIAVARESRVFTPYNYKILTFSQHWAGTTILAGNFTKFAKSKRRVPTSLSHTSSREYDA